MSDLTFPPKDKVVHRWFVRLTTHAWRDSRGIHVRKDLNWLKRRSTGWNQLKEDCDDIGTLDAVEAIENLYQYNDGIYEIKMHTSRDWESGYIDDWYYTLERVEE